MGKLKYTFDDYINNPSGKGSAVLAIKAYYVKFFSNDSNFVYTYAYSFKSHGVLITELEKLLPFRCISQKPVMRNPDNAMGYNKGIIYAYLIMVRDGLFNKETLNRNCKYANITAIRNTILPFDKKLQERRKIEEELKKAGKEQKQEPAKVSKTVSNVKTTSRSSTAKKVKKR